MPQEPLLNMKSSFWGTSLPQRLKVYDGFFEVTSMERNMVSRTTQRTRYERIAQISVVSSTNACRGLQGDRTGGMGKTRYTPRWWKSLTAAFLTVVLVLSGTLSPFPRKRRLAQ